MQVVAFYRKKDMKNKPAGAAFQEATSRPALRPAILEFKPMPPKPPPTKPPATASPRAPPSLPPPKEESPREQSKLVGNEPLSPPLGTKKVAGKIGSPTTPATASTKKGKPARTQHRSPFAYPFALD